MTPDNLPPVERSRERHIVLEALRDEQHRVASVRGWNALMLARTPEAWSQLLQGEPVPTDQLDHAHLATMRARRV